jgi:agmatine deiminase
MIPQTLGFKMPAEWAPHERCWMAWPCHKDTWSTIGFERAQNVYALVANTIAEFEPVYMLVKPSNMAHARKRCGEGVHLLPLALDDSWTRDTGPTFLLDANGQLGGVDWDHNAWGGNYSDCEHDKLIAKHIITDVNAHYFKAPLVMEGGALHVDGEGTLLTTRECLLNINRNPHLNQDEIEQYLRDYLGVEKIIWLNKGVIGDETDGHIDEIACFAKPGVVLSLITYDKHDENYDILQANHEQLKTETDAKGRALQVIPVEQPPATYENGERLTLSYINFYRANDGIVMPAFGCKEADDKALGIFIDIFPNLGVRQINTLDLFTGGGGIHCITQQQPKALA